MTMTNLEILAENRIGDATHWIRIYLMKYPDWTPTLKQIRTMSEKFKLTEGKVLKLYERVIDERDLDNKVQEVIGIVIETQNDFSF